MAKRGSSRKAPTDDDEFAWQSPEEDEQPKKKSSKKKSSTGKARAADDSARSKSSLKNSGSARKKASGKASARRKRESGDDDDLETSGRKRRAAPAPKKGVDPIIPISIISVTLLVCLGLFLLGRKPPKIHVNENNDFDKAKKLQEEGMTAFREFNKAKKDGPPDLMLRKQKEATDKLQAAIEAMNAILDKYRDAEGMLPSHLEGYERDMSEISQIIIDIEKSGGLGN